jgi:hypothetical protein
VPCQKGNPRQRTKPASAIKENKEEKMEQLTPPESLKTDPKKKKSHITGYKAREKDCRELKIRGASRCF